MIVLCGGFDVWIVVCDSTTKDSEEEVSIALSLWVLNARLDREWVGPVEDTRLDDVSMADPHRGPAGPHIHY